MSFTTKIPDRNPFAMRPVIDNRPARYKRGHLSTSWQRDLILSFQAEKEYKIKYERAQRFRFPFSSVVSDAADITLEIINCKGETVHTITDYLTADVPGNVTDDNTQLYYYWYKAPNLEDVTEDGTYYVLLSVNYGSEMYQAISHPIWIKDEHEGTMLIEATHSENIDGVYFEQVPGIIPFLVEAYLGRMISKNTSTVFEGQDYGVTQLQSVSYREWPLLIGHTGEGIPDYVKNLLADLLDLDRVLFDGQQYLRAIGANFEDEGSEISPLYATKINLREPENKKVQTYTDRTIALYTIPSFPYAIKSINLLGARALKIAGPTVIEDASAQTAFITALTAALSDLELEGTYEVAGGVLNYEAAEGEDFTSAASVIFTDYTEYELDKTVVITTQVKLRGASTVLDWGDGVYEDGDSFVSVNQTFSHTYDSGTYTVRIWGTYLGITLADTERQTFGATSLPVWMEDYVISNGRYAGDAFPFSLFANTPRLKMLWSPHTELTTAVGFNSIYLPALKSINFSFNELPSSVVNAFMFDVWYNSSNHGANSPVTSGGTFSIVGQSPAAILNAFGSSYKSVLKAFPYNWTVNN